MTPEISCFEIRFISEDARSIKILHMLRNHGLDGFVDNYPGNPDYTSVIVDGSRYLENRVHAAAEEIRAFYGLEVVYVELRSVCEVRAISLDTASVR